MTRPPPLPLISQAMTGDVALGVPMLNPGLRRLSMPKDADATSLQEAADRADVNNVIKAFAFDEINVSSPAEAVTSQPESVCTTFIAASPAAVECGSPWKVASVTIAGPGEGAGEPVSPVRALHDMDPIEAFRHLASQIPSFKEAEVASALRWLVLHNWEVEVGWSKYAGTVSGLLERLLYFAGFDDRRYGWDNLPSYATPFARDAFARMEAGRPVAAVALTSAAAAMRAAENGMPTPELTKCVATVFEAVAERADQLTVEEVLASAAAGVAVDLALVKDGASCPWLVAAVQRLAHLAATRARELRGPALADAAWTLCRFDRGSAETRSLFTWAIAERIDAVSALELAPRDLSKLAAALAGAGIQSCSAALALGVAARCHAAATGLEGGLDLVSLAESLALLAPGHEQVSWHLGEAILKCSRSLRPTDALVLAQILGSFSADIDFLVAEVLASRLLVGLAEGAVPTGAWACALEALEPHAQQLDSWPKLVAAVDSNVRVPSAADLLALVGRMPGIPSLLQPDICKSFLQLTVDGFGRRLPQRLLADLGVLADPEEPWVSEARRAMETTLKGLNPSTCSCSAVSYDFAAVSAINMGEAEDDEKVRVVRPRQSVLARDRSVPSTLEGGQTLAFLSAGEAAGVCAAVAGLLEAFTTLLRSVAGVDGEWRASGKRSHHSRFQDTCEDEEEEGELLVLAPGGFPCAMTDLRAFRPWSATGNIRLLCCCGQPPRPEFLVVLATMLRLLPGVSLAVAMDENDKLLREPVNEAVDEQLSFRALQISSPALSASERQTLVERGVENMEAALCAPLPSPVVPAPAQIATSSQKPKVIRTSCAAMRQPVHCLPEPRVLKASHVVGAANAVPTTTATTQIMKHSRPLGVECSRTVTSMRAADQAVNVHRQPLVLTRLERCA